MQLCWTGVGAFRPSSLQVWRAQSDRPSWENDEVGLGFEDVSFKTWGLDVWVGSVGVVRDCLGVFFTENKGKSPVRCSSSMTAAISGGNKEAAAIIYWGLVLLGPSIGGPSYYTVIGF